MANFAEIDENNKVIRVLVVENDVIKNDAGEEVEALGISFLKQLCGENTRWIQTSYNGNFRKNFAGIGYTYNAAFDGFIPPKIFASWILDEATCSWVAPIPYPDDGLSYGWNEEKQAWVRFYTAEETQRAVQEYIDEVKAKNSTNL